MPFELFNCDCLEAYADIDFSNVVIVSDPPFNIGYHYSAYADTLPEDEYMEWLVEVFKPAPHVLIHYPEKVVDYVWQAGLRPDKLAAWVYNANTPRQYRTIAFFGVKPDFTRAGHPYKNPRDKRIQKRILEGKQARLYDWWYVNQVKNVSREKSAHPCQMPLEVMDRIVKILPPEKTILDPFMGSGTTGVAALRNGRRFIGMELDERYFEIAKERLQNLRK